MGHYTELKIKVHLKRNTPQEVIDIFDRIICCGEFEKVPTDSPFLDDDNVWVPDIKHMFFQCERYQQLLTSTNWGTTRGGLFYKSRNHWVVDLHTEFKDYGSEIFHFLDFISPYVGGRKRATYLGWYKFEFVCDRTYLYINCSNLPNIEKGLTLPEAPKAVIK